MKNPRDSFDPKNYYAEGFVSALLLCFAAFSILPISMANFVAEGTEEISYTRVYSTAVNDNQKSPPAAKHTSSAIPVRGVAQGTPAESESAPSPLLSASKIEVSLGGTSANAGDFALSQFAATPSADGFKIGTFELSELDKVPRRLRGTAPKYPPNLLKRGIEGRVKLLVIIDENGAVSADKVLSSDNPEFEASALQAVGGLLYECPTKNGKPARAKFVLPIPFKISGQ